MRWFGYIWIIVAGLFWLIWTIFAFDELITTLRLSKLSKEELSAIVDQVIDCVWFMNWLCIHAAAIFIGSLLYWMVKIL